MKHAWGMKNLLFFLNFSNLIMDCLKEIIFTLVAHFKNFSFFGGTIMGSKTWFLDRIIQKPKISTLLCDISDIFSFQRKSLRTRKLIKVRKLTKIDFFNSPTTMAKLAQKSWRPFWFTSFSFFFGH